MKKEEEEEEGSSAINCTLAGAYSLRHVTHSDKTLRINEFAFKIQKLSPRKESTFCLTAWPREMCADLITREVT